MSHTPTPWRTEKLPHIERGHEDVPRFRLWSGKTPVIDGFILDEQDAAFIVRAVNSHDRLVEALRLVRSIIVDGAPHGFNPLEGDWAERLYASQAATAKALRDAGEGL
jgi:dienelactone hydrolase